VEAGAGSIDEPPSAPFTSRGEWVASSGVPEEEWNAGAWLGDPHGLGPRVSILPVSQGEVAKNRLHMDVRVPGGGSEDERWARLTAAVEELFDAGGRVLQRFLAHHVVTADPEGNEFCMGFTGLEGARRAVP